MAHGAPAPRAPAAWSGAETGTRKGEGVRKGAGTRLERGLGRGTSAPFGAVLRDWRARRRTSQLDLALGAEVSARHVSFLETGRARPSRSMVLRLARELDVPMDARNEWLVAAGFAPLYERRDPDAEEMRMAGEAVAWMVDRHDPYPGFALDRNWRIVRANGTATRLLGGFGIGAGDSLLDAFLGDAALRGAIANLAEVAAHTRARLIAESRHYGGDAVLDAAAERLRADARAHAAHPSGARAPGADEPGAPAGAFVPVRYRLDGTELSLFSAFSHFLNARDVAMAELRVELMFPADAATRRVLTG